MNEISLRIIYLTLIFCSLFFKLNAQKASPRKPFPDHTKYSEGTVLPEFPRNEMDEDVLSFYNVWRPHYIVPDHMYPDQYYVLNDSRHREQGEINCSEGQGYGMIIVALMATPNDTTSKRLFDALFRYYRFHLTKRSAEDHSVLMSWKQTKHKNHDDAAPDGDMDIAYSLLLAYEQWGNQGKIKYLDEAIRLLNDIVKYEINSFRYYILLSDDDRDSLHDNNYFNTRSSDFMPSHFRVFKWFSKNNVWDSLIDKNYSLFLNLQNKHSGLVPDFVMSLNANPYAANVKVLESAEHDGDYYHNACRVPWRIATDYILNKNRAAKDFLDKINQWIVKASDGDVNHISEGYHLNGSPFGEDSENFPVMCYICPFGISAMVDSSNRIWLNKLWAYIKNQRLLPETRKEKREGRFDYYNNTIKMLGMIILSGNYWEPIPDFGVAENDNGKHK
jgi:endoglucanase